MFDIFPAIDLKDGKAVRLLKGEMQSAKIYGEALEFAKGFESMGAKWLHIVDLDGAVRGDHTNFEVIKNIVQSTSIRVQVGGGIRDEESILRYLDLGVKRVILGSVALKNLDFTLKMAEKYPVVVGIDAKNGQVAIHGWKETQNVDAIAFAKNFKDSHIQAIICTDISRDGALLGLNLDFTLDIARASQKPTIASGGFANADEITTLKNQLADGGLIIGKAFYEKKINLGEILKGY